MVLDVVVKARSRVEPSTAISGKKVGAIALDVEVRAEPPAEVVERERAAGALVHGGEVHLGGCVDAPGRAGPRARLERAGGEVPVLAVDRERVFLDVAGVEVNARSLSIEGRPQLSVQAADLVAVLEALERRVRVPLRRALRGLELDVEPDAAGAEIGLDPGDPQEGGDVQPLGADARRERARMHVELAVERLPRSLEPDPFDVERSAARASARHARGDLVLVLRESDDDVVRGDAPLGNDRALRRYGRAPPALELRADGDSPGLPLRRHIEDRIRVPARVQTLPRDRDRGGGGVEAPCHRAADGGRAHPDGARGEVLHRRLQVRPHPLGAERHVSIRAHEDAAADRAAEEQRLR